MVVIPICESFLILAYYQETWGRTEEADKFDKFDKFIFLFDPQPGGMRGNKSYKQKLKRFNIPQCCTLNIILAI